MKKNIVRVVEIGDPDREDYSYDIVIGRGRRVAVVLRRYKTRKGALGAARAWAKATGFEFEK